MTGGCLSTASLLLSSFFENFTALTLAYGGLLGVSLGMIALPSMLCVNMYFESKRTLAVALVLSGSCLGFFVTAPALEYTIRNYGLQVTFRCMSGFTGVFTLLGLALKPPSTRLLVVEEKDSFGRRRSVLKMNNSEQLQEMGKNIEPLDRADIFYRHSIVVIDDEDLQTKAPAFDRKASYVSVHSVKLQEARKSLIRSFFANMFDKEICTNKTFWVYMVAKFLFALILVVPHIYIPNMMTSHELSSAHGGIAMSVLAASHGVGRLLSGLFTKYSQHALTIQGAACSVSTLSLIALPHCSTSLQFYIAAGVYGLSIAPKCVLNSTILVNIVGMAGLSTAYGMEETIYGVGAMIGPILVGMSVDYFESYHVPFYLAGACFGMAVIINSITSKLLSSSSKVLSQQ